MLSSAWTYRFLICPPWMLLGWTGWEVALVGVGRWGLRALKNKDGMYLRSEESF